MVLQSLPLNKIAVSACLVGEKCRYDGKFSKDISELKGCVKLCPEVLGGLTIPRTACQIDNGDGDDVICGRAKVIAKDGRDCTDEFIKGAKEALKICLENDITIVILKEKSPSCGKNFVYNDDILIDGCGVTAAFLKQHGIEIISDTEVADE